MDSDSKYSLTENYKNFTHNILWFPSPYDWIDYGTRVDFEVQEGTVVAIRLANDIGGHMFDLRKLYKEYGSPDRILIVPEGCYLINCNTNIYFLYDNQRFMSVNLVQSDLNDSEISLCVSRHNWGYITTWSSNVNIDIDFGETKNPEFIPFEQVANLAIGEFFEQLTKNGEACFKAPVDLWK